MNKSVEKSCSLCTEPLTCDNIVNTKCRHSCCCDCFWKWAEQSNQCPYCRKEMIQNPDRAIYLELGRDIDRRQQRIDDLRAEYDMLSDMCQNKSIATVSLGLDYDQLRVDFKCLEDTYCDLVQKVAAAQHDEYMLDLWLRRKQTLVNQVALWEKDPKRAIKMWKKAHMQRQHQDRRACMHMLRHCFMEMSLVFAQRFESSSLRHALHKIKRMHKGTTSASRCASRTRRRRIEQIPELCIAGLWIDDEDCAEIRQRQRIIAAVAQEAVNAYFYLAHCSCSRIGAILATEPRAPSQQVAVQRFEAVRRAHQVMATVRLRRCYRSRRACLTGLEHIRPYRALPAYSRLAGDGGGGGGSGGGGGGDAGSGLRADAPPWNPITNRVETIASEQVRDGAEVIDHDSDMQLAAQLLQQMIREGRLNRDVREVEIRISDQRSVVFSRVRE